MARKKVIKRSGKEQKFSSRKIEKSIEKAVKDLTKDISKSIEKTIGKKGYVKTKKIRDEVLKKLDKMSKGAAKEWRRYEKKLQKKF